MGRLRTFRSRFLRPPSYMSSDVRALPSSIFPTHSSATCDHYACRTLRYFTSEKPFSHSPSKRRVKDSPILSLESVALPPLLREQVQKYIKRHDLTARQLRANAASINSARAPESLNQKLGRNLGQPIVPPSPVYGNSQTAAFVAIRMPGTYTANVFVLAEAARLLPGFSPSSILDFGSGPGTSLLAASRVFPSEEENECATQRHVKDRSILSKASLIDRSPSMRSFAAEVASADPAVRNIPVNYLSDLRECSHQETFDIVSCSYSLHEIVRDALSSPSTDKTGSSEKLPISRQDRVRAAEARLLRTAKTLWSRTAPMGLFVVIEDGTAAGFETISFVRDFILKTSAPFEKVRHGDVSKDVEIEVPVDKITGLSTRPKVRAKVIAPCLHSLPCPLNGSITRHRLCRFQQRLNRPQFSRTALPMSTGYEDERFSFLVVQKIVAEERDEEIDSEQGCTAWGRLIRQPLLNGKHVTLDACTREATLERRVVAKKNAGKGVFSLARRAKWGDVWPHVPSGAPQKLNF